MSLTSELANLIQSSAPNEYRQELEWFPCSKITGIMPSEIYNTYYTVKNNDNTNLILVFLGNNKEYTPTLVSEFARIYSLPTHRYRNDVNQFRRYTKWLNDRNKHIIGFTKYKDNYYMVADVKFYRCYSRYGFCSACGILRCSPVWCICGHKQLSNGWTSNNKKLDEFIRKSQLQTNSPNHAYLEWIPFNCIDDGGYSVYLYGLPTYERTTLIPLETTDNLYYAEVNHLLTRHVIDSLNNY